MSNKPSNIYYELSIISKQISKKLDKVSTEEIIKKLIYLKKSQPNEIKVYNYLSLFYNKSSKYLKAINICKESIHLFPNDSNNYYIISESFLKLNKTNEAISNLKKAVLINNNNHFAHNALGNIYWKNNNLDEAISCFENVLKINPSFKDVEKKIKITRKKRLGLINHLTYHLPKKNDNLSAIIIVNDKLQKINSSFSLNCLIEDSKIIELINAIQQIIEISQINTDFQGSQIFRKGIIKYNCTRHFKIFNEFKVIPYNCFSCYKIQIEPKNIIEFIKLYLVFENLNLAKNLTRKCMIETRKNISGKYKGYIYCIGLKEAEHTLKLINPILDNTIGVKIPRFIKRGCSEFGIAHPDYKELDPSNKNFMKYNETWKEKEEIIDSELNAQVKGKKLIDEDKFYMKKNKIGITIRDALVIYNWLFYAQKIKDENVKKLSKKIPYSSFIDKKFL